ncbi:ureidoglycine aminohydrolase [Wolffia australiana]
MSNSRSFRLLSASRPLFLFLMFIARFGEARGTVLEEGFCAASAGTGCELESAKSIYWKVTNPTLSPAHFEDLPGFTRSAYRRDHALITTESHVFSPLLNWTNTLGAYLITPAMGSHFSMYLAKMQPKSTSALPPQNVERFVFLVEGSATLSCGFGCGHLMGVDTYAYFPANFDHSLEADEAATLVLFERRQSTLKGHVTEMVFGSTAKQPLLETPGEVFKLRKLLPTSPSYDFNIHIMDFEPGEYLNVKEVHYNQHGLLLLQGQGIYRLGDNWYPVQAGDAIWMAPFVPQWYGALGKSPSRYLLYKDVNRDPL